MHTAYLIVTIFAAAWVGFSAFAIVRKMSFVAEPLDSYGVPRTWWPWLGAAKAAGAVGLFVGIWVSWIGVAAGIGVIAYFLGAIITIIRARSFVHIPIPMMYIAPVTASLILI